MQPERRLDLAGLQVQVFSAFVVLIGVARGVTAGVPALNTKQEDHETGQQCIDREMQVQHPADLRDEAQHQRRYGSEYQPIEQLTAPIHCPSPLVGGGQPARWHQDHPPLGRPPRREGLHPTTKHADAGDRRGLLLGSEDHRNQHGTPEHDEDDNGKERQTVSNSWGPNMGTPAT